MNRIELVNLQKQIEEEFKAVKNEFEQFCDSSDCSSFVGSDEEKEELLRVLLDGEQYDELEADIQNIFFFVDGKARRKFDVLRNKGGLLCRLYKTINDVTKEEATEDEWFERLEDYEIESLVKASEQVIAEEQAFLKIAEKGLSLLNELPEE